MKMKKLNFIFIILIIFLVGCGNGKSVTKAAGKATGYSFESKGITIAMKDKVAPILKKLGKENDYFEADSCAFQGKEKTYTYNGFELHTYEKNKVDYVASIDFLDDTVSTKEGISLASNLEDVLKAYGNKYTEKSGVYTYVKDKVKLIITINNQKVEEIKYVAIEE